MNILLIGPRGSGKSTIGPRLAEAMALPFIDLDERVLNCFEEQSVSEIWAVHGESAWRNAEIDILDSVLGDDRQVIALGGGVPMIEVARHRIDVARREGEAVVVYLRCDSDELRERLSQQPGDRPSLTGDDPLEEIKAVLSRREPVYQGLTDRVIETADQTIEEVLQQLSSWLSDRSPEFRKVDSQGAD